MVKLWLSGNVILSVEMDEDFFDYLLMILEDNNFERHYISLTSECNALSRIQSFPQYVQWLL